MHVVIPILVRNTTRVSHIIRRSEYRAEFDAAFLFLSNGYLFCDGVGLHWFLRKRLPARTSIS